MSTWSTGGGRDQLADALGALMRAEHFDRIERLGLIYDAEGDAAAMGQKIQGALRQCGLPVPSNPLKTASSPGKPLTAYLVVPHGAKTGCIEHLLIGAYHHGQVGVQRAEKYVADAASGRAASSQWSQENWAAKAKIHSLIAVSQQPEATLGESALAGLWDPDHEVLKPIRDLIELLS